MVTALMHPCVFHSHTKTFLALLNSLKTVTSVLKANTYSYIYISLVFDEVINNMVMATVTGPVKQSHTLGTKICLGELVMIIHSFTHSSIHPSTHLLIHPSIHPSTYLSINQSIYLSTHLSIL